MRTFRLRLTLMVALSVVTEGSPAVAQTKTPNDPLPYQLYGKARIIDGRSFEIPAMGETVRLLGYEAPELGQIARTEDIAWPAGEVARSWLILNTLQRVVNCKPEQRDKAGRILAHCFVGDRNLALAAIEEGIGYAYSYPSEPRVPIYSDAERRARGLGLGIWSGHLEPPWEFRARLTSQNLESVKPAAVEKAPVIPLTLPAEEEAAASSLSATTKDSGTKPPTGDLSSPPRPTRPAGKDAS